jgi:fructose-specific phosphotransferase system IIC component
LPVVDHRMAYVAAIVLGTLVTAILIVLLKLRSTELPQEEKEPA